MIAMRSVGRKNGGKIGHCAGVRAACSCAGVSCLSTCSAAVVIPCSSPQFHPRGTSKAPHTFWKQIFVPTIILNYHFKSYQYIILKNLMLF